MRNMQRWPKKPKNSLKKKKLIESIETTLEREMKAIKDKELKQTNSAV